MQLSCECSLPRENRKNRVLLSNLPYEAFLKTPGIMSVRHTASGIALEDAEQAWRRQSWPSCVSMASRGRSHVAPGFLLHSMCLTPEPAGRLELDAGCAPPRARTDNWWVRAQTQNPEHRNWHAPLEGCALLSWVIDICKEIKTLFLRTHWGLIAQVLFDYETSLKIKKNMMRLG